MNDGVDLQCVADQQKRRDTVIPQPVARWRSSPPRSSPPRTLRLACRPCQHWVWMWVWVLRVQLAVPQGMEYVSCDLNTPLTVLCDRGATAMDDVDGDLTTYLLACRYVLKPSVFPVAPWPKLVLPSVSGPIQNREDSANQREPSSLPPTAETHCLPHDDADAERVVAAGCD
jgi:hypothetical protein